MHGDLDLEPSDPKINYRAYFQLMGSSMIIGVKREQLCDGIVSPNPAIFSYQCIDNLDLWPFDSKLNRAHP